MVKVKEAVDYMHYLVETGGIDVDGHWGKQCVDLSNAIPSKFFNTRLGGNAIDLLNSAKAKGWQVVYDAPGVNPKAGAIFVTKEAHQYGHTGVVIEDSDGITIKTVEQNIDGYRDNNRDGIDDSFQVGGQARYNTRDFSNIVGWFYPPYEDFNVGNEGEKEMTKKVLLIAGHGAGDPGAVGGGYTEEGLTRQLVKAMVKLDPTLDHYDYNRDCFDDNGLQTYGLARKYDEIVEFHLDASTNLSVTGGHTIIHLNFRPDNTDKAIQAVVNKWVGTFRGHAATGGFSYRNNLLNLNVAAASGHASYRLVELGFISNPNDRSIVVNNIEAIASDLVKAIRGEVKTTKPALKPISEVARLVRLGRYGNYPARKVNLEKEGYNYEEVKAEVERQKKK